MDTNLDEEFLSKPGSYTFKSKTSIAKITATTTNICIALSFVMAETMRLGIFGYSIWFALDSFGSK